MHILSSNTLLFKELLSLEWRVTFTCIATFIVNLPFGYLRGRFRKLSFWWFASIHLPVPLIIIIRKFFDLHLTWELAPFLVGSFFLGQFAGRRFYKFKPWKKPEKKIDA